MAPRARMDGRAPKRVLRVVSCAAGRLSGYFATMRLQVLALCSLSLVGCQPPQAEAPAAPTVLEGDFTVAYKLRTSDTTTGGDPALKVKRIAFHEG